MTQREKERGNQLATSHRAAFGAAVEAAAAAEASTQHEHRQRQKTMDAPYDVAWRRESGKRRGNESGEIKEKGERKERERNIPLSRRERKAGKAERGRTCWDGGGRKWLEILDGEATVLEGCKMWRIIQWVGPFVVKGWRESLLY